MKRFLCILMCLMLLIPAATAEEMTPTKRFRQQFVVGGNGMRGTVSLTASGVAEWLNILMPFTAAKLQVRAIGEAQGDLSDMVTDDDDWQIKLYAEDEQGNPKALTYIYGGPEALYISSELLPDTLLTLPVKDVHIPYQLIRGDFFAMLNSFDPLNVTKAGRGENLSAYSAVANLLQIGEEEWNERWEPVLEKYYTELDLWLSAYAAAPVVSGTTGHTTMRTSYNIPAADLKQEAKHLVGLMIYDHELQALMMQHVTTEQRALYLNPSLMYFYEYCIDTLPLSGNILLEREMTVMGETVGMGVSLPLPELPAELTDSLGRLLKDAFSLPYDGVLADLQRISFSQSEDDVSISVSSPARTISLIVEESVANAETSQKKGFVRIMPAEGSAEPQLSAAFTYKTSKRLWEDDEWAKHEDMTFSVAVEPDASLTDAADPLQSGYVDFLPISFDASVGYTHETDRPNRPVKIAVTINAVLPDAEVGLTANLRTAEQWAHETLPTAGAENMAELSETRVKELLDLLTENAVKTMLSLQREPEQVEQNAAPVTMTEAPTAEPTVVPPM